MIEGKVVLALLLEERVRDEVAPEEKTDSSKITFLEIYNQWRDLSTCNLCG